MAIPDPSKAGSPFCVLQTDGWNPKTPEINNFFIPEIALRGGYEYIGILRHIGAFGRSHRQHMAALTLARGSTRRGPRTDPSHLLPPEDPSVAF